MNANTANLLNAAVLIAMSIWAYVSVSMASITPLIPAAFGVALLFCAPGVRTENKVIAHVAVVLTLLVFIALFMPLRSMLSAGDTLGLVRVLAMQATSLLAMVFFIKSFRDARLAREAAGGS